MTRALILALALALVGCAAEPLAPGFTTPYAVTYRVVPDREFTAWCGIPHADACATVDFFARTCEIVLKERHQFDIELVWHERRHCMGWTHKET